MNWPQGTLGALNTALSCVAWIIPLGVRQAFGVKQNRVVLRLLVQSN